MKAAVRNGRCAAYQVRMIEQQGKQGGVVGLQRIGEMNELGRERGNCE
jgi:hypothetical protein